MPTSTSGQASTSLNDLWSCSSTYRQQFQRVDEIDEIVRLLELETAEGLVDVGCGNGAFVAAAARAHPHLRVWAFDALESAVAASAASATGLGERFTTGVAWAESLPLPDAAVDRAMCRAVLHHVPDAPRAHRELARVVRPGGLLLLQAPCNYWDQPWGRVINELYRLADDSHPRHYHRPCDVIAGLSDAGLAMGQAACWTYAYPRLSEPQVQLVREKGATERFRLRQAGDGSWAVELYWVRVIAQKL